MEKNMTLQNLDPGVSTLDLLAEVARRFAEEKEEKNRAYSFILSKGLFQEYRDYVKRDDANEMRTTEGRIAAFTKQI